MDRSALPASLAGWLDAPSRWTALDPVADRIRRGIARLPVPPVARALLRGSWLGHPLHPALAQVPVGCWLSATVLDLTGGSQVAVRRLTAVGLAAVPPTLAAGWLDWAELPPELRRTGLLHAEGAVGAAALYAASLRARRHGRTAAARGLGLAGLAVVTGAATFGGHLAYRQTVGAGPAEQLAGAAEPERPVLGVAAVRRTG